MTPAFSLFLQHVRREWREHDVALRPGVTELSIRQFEESHGVSLPGDLVEYFLTVDGMNEEDSDQHSIRFWPLSEVRPSTVDLAETGASLLKDYFGFADYCLWAHGYAIRLGRGLENEVAIVGGEAPIVIAQTFREFLMNYVEQPEKLFAARA